MNVYIESLGCARNQVDSETMQARLLSAGCRIADDPAQAEVIVVNTCSFIESAADESIDTILALADFKHTGRCRRLVVAGCLPERYREQSAAVLPEVDLFLGTGAYDRIVSAVTGGLAAGTCLLPDPDRVDVLQTPLRASFAAPAAYVKITEGCNRHCTYCIIPKLRGRQKSRPWEHIVTECRALIADGVKEITLVGQETTAYGADGGSPLDLARLLEVLAQLDPSVWIRFLYGHPQSLTPAVIATVARFPNLCPYFDIPIQHASDGVLQRMGRAYGADDLLRLFDAIRSGVPEAVLRTTVIVGFPGEREEDFQQLYRMMEQVRFDHLGVFTYSDAEDLVSHRLPGHVEPELAQERQDELMVLQRHISTRNLTRYLDRELAVLVEEGPEEGEWTGRNRFQAPEVDGNTYLTVAEGAPRLTIGSLVTARVVDSLEYDLVAHVGACPTGH
jgi:ribosomal protein S12 methylthiotransferase